MSTNASITAKLSNGKYASIYVHYDGYLSHTGAILLASYATQERVDMLMDLGDLSQLGPYVGCPDSHTWTDPVKHYCIAYHRDRWEKKSLSISNSAIVAWKNGPGLQQYNYIWDGEQWYQGAPGYLDPKCPLTIDQLSEEANVHYNMLTQLAEE